MIGLGQMTCKECLQFGPWGGSQCSNMTGFTFGFAAKGKKFPKDTHMIMWPPYGPGEEVHALFVQGRFIVRNIIVENF